MQELLLTLVKIYIFSILQSYLERIFFELNLQFLLQHVITCLVAKCLVLHRLFLIWYMIVGDQKTADMDAMFASLVPGFPTPPPRVAVISGPEGAKVSGVDPLPIIPSSSTDKAPDDITAYLLSSVLEFMVSQVRFVIICLNSEYTHYKNILFC